MCGQSISASGPLTSLCDTLNCTASGAAAVCSLGEFSRTEMCWRGKPVFRNSRGWLLHQSPAQGWTVGDLGTGGLEGSMAVHCAAGEKKWTYWDGFKYQRATVKIEYKVHVSKKHNTLV